MLSHSYSVYLARSIIILVPKTWNNWFYAFHPSAHTKSITASHLFCSRLVSPTFCFRLSAKASALM